MTDTEIKETILSILKGNLGSGIGLTKGQMTNQLISLGKSIDVGKVKIMLDGLVNSGHLDKEVKDVSQGVPNGAYYSIAQKEDFNSIGPRIALTLPTQQQPQNKLQPKPQQKQANHIKSFQPDRRFQALKCAIELVKDEIGGSGAKKMAAMVVAEELYEWLNKEIR